MREVKLTAQEIAIIKRALISHMGRLYDFLNSHEIDPKIVESDYKTVKRLLDETL